MRRADRQFLPGPRLAPYPRVAVTVRRSLKDKTELRLNTMHREVVFLDRSAACGFSPRSKIGWNEKAGYLRCAEPTCYGRFKG